MAITERERKLVAAAFDKYERNIAAMTATTPPKAVPAPARMSLASVTKGRRREPRRILLYGVPKIGKTTFAAQAPNPIFIESVREQGSGEQETQRFQPCESWEDIFDAIKALENESHDRKTVVIDTLDAFEPLIWDFLCREEGVKDKEKYGGGFNKWVDAEVREWNRMLQALDRLRSKKGMEYILLAHSMIEVYNNPSGENYDRFALKVHKKSAAFIIGSVDVCLFAQHETAYKKDGNRKYKGKSTGARVIQTEYNAAWVAGNRYSLPSKIPLSWADFDAAFDRPPRLFDDLKADVEVKIDDVKDATIKAKARETLAKAEANNKDVYLMEKLDNRLSVVLSQQEE